MEEDLWHIQVPQLNDEPTDAKIEVSVEDKSKQVWKYNVNIIHYDGTKKNVTFEVDIDNGTIKGQNDYASLIIGKWRMTSGNAVATHVTYKNDGTFEYTSTEDSSYKEVGKYKIDGNKLYEMYSDEEFAKELDKFIFCATNGCGDYYCYHEDSDGETKEHP